MNNVNLNANPAPNSVTAVPVTAQTPVDPISSSQPLDSAQVTLPTLTPTPEPDVVDYSKWKNPDNNTQKNQKNLIALIIIFAVLLFVGVAVGALYIRFRPKWELAHSIARTVSSDSLHMDLVAPLDEGRQMNVSTDFFQDPTLLTSNNLTIILPTANAESATITLKSLVNNDSSYLKLEHSQMNQLYNLLLTTNPQLSGDSSFKAIEPMLHGDSWIHYKESSGSTDTPSYPSQIEVFLGLAAGTTINSSAIVEIEGIEYQQYVMGLNSVTANEILDTISENQQNLSVADVIQLRTALNNSTHLSDDIIRILVNKKSDTITTVEITLPQELIQELKANQEISETNSNPLITLQGHPLALLGWLESTTGQPHLSLSISNIDKAVPATVPQQLIESSSIEDPSIIGFVMQYVLNPKNILTATGTDNAYITATHETKLFFDKGDYKAGLSKANEALNLAQTDDDRAIAYYWIGLQTFKLGQSNEAETFLLKAASIKDKYAAPYVTLAAISLERGNYQQMLEYAQQCAVYDPSYAWCYNNIGIALHSLGRTQEAIEAMEKAVSLDPNSFIFNDNLKRARGG